LQQIDKLKSTNVNWLGQGMTLAIFESMVVSILESPSKMARGVAPETAKV
jgi:hypothetical protein